MSHFLRVAFHIVSLPALTMNILVLRRAFGFLSFIVAAVTYMLTVQESVPFWDCGEFTAAVAEQQVPQVQAVAQKQAVSAEQMFWADLTKNVSNWREINDNKEFHSWLLEVDPLTGISRQTYLEDAQRMMDAGRVANFFRAWLEDTGQANVAQTKSRATSSELEKQVTPGRTKSAGNPQSSKAKVYTPQDIQKFFNDVRQGKYKVS